MIPLSEAELDKLALGPACQDASFNAIRAFKVGYRLAERAAIEANTKRLESEIRAQQNRETP